MNIDLAVFAKEYEQTIRDLSARLAGYAIREAVLQARVTELEEAAKAEAAAKADAEAKAAVAKAAETPAQ